MAAAEDHRREKNTHRLGPETADHQSLIALWTGLVSPLAVVLFFSLYCWQTYHLSPNPLSLWSCCWNRLRSDLNQFGCDTGSQQKSCSLISGLVYLKPVFQCHGTTERTSTVTSHLVPLPPCILKKKYTNKNWKNRTNHTKHTGAAKQCSRSVNTFSFDSGLKTWKDNFGLKAWEEKVTAEKKKWPSVGA